MIELAAMRALPRGTHRIACPDCAKGPRDTALSVTVKDDGSIVWVCFRCYAKGGARGERSILTVAHSRKPRSEHPGVAHRVSADGTLDLARSIWKQTVPLAGTDGAAYLALRCCELPPPEGDLRFHHALYCADVKAELPALVAKVTTVEGNRAIGIHRIWIHPGDAKAIGKKRLGGASDVAACIRLWPDEAVEIALGIAEGVETALAAARRFKPMWSTIDAGQMAKFPLLAGIESLTIFADFDTAGMKAATAAQRRYFAAGRQAQLVRSRIVGEDFNDVLLRTQR